MRQHAFERRQHQLLALADGEAADAVAGEVHADQRFRRAAAQARIDAALHDAEQRLPRRRPLGEGDARPLGPAQRQLHGALGFLMLGRQFDALVELHLDVGAEQALDLDGALRRQHVPRLPSMCDGKAHALLAHLADLGERHDLEAAASR